METHSRLNIKSIVPIAIIIIAVLSVALFFFLNQNPKSTNAESFVGDWQESIIPSDELESIFETDLDKYTRNSIYTALEEYFLSLYPNGTGLNFTEYNDENEYSLRLITSYGTFHTMTVISNEESTTIKIDDSFEKNYPIIYPEREGYEEE